LDRPPRFYQYRHLTQEQHELLLRYRQQHGYPWHAPPHPVREAAHYLFTAANFEHRPIMSSEERRHAFQARLLERLQAGGIDVCAWVILPNHYHVLALVPDFDNVAPAFQRLHGSSSRQWNLEDGTVGRKVWYRYTDRAMRTERHFYTTVNYLHYNPVKHEWTDRADEWVSSSIWAYLETKERAWLIDLWREYPVREYGKGWDW
jgi:putative transposase